MWAHVSWPSLGNVVGKMLSWRLSPGTRQIPSEASSAQHSHNVFGFYVRRNVLLIKNTRTSRNNLIAHVHTHLGQPPPPPHCESLHKLWNYLGKFGLNATKTNYNVGLIRFSRKRRTKRTFGNRIGNFPIELVFAPNNLEIFPISVWIPTHVGLETPRFQPTMGWNPN